MRDKPLYHEDGKPAGTLRIFSVGLTNSGETAKSVSVKVVQIQPAELKAYWTSSLHVANESVDMSQRDIHQSTTPLAFFEVSRRCLKGANPQHLYESGLRRLACLSDPWRWRTNTS